ncbi:AraC family transcriptional regulator [Catenulispora pinisilvae]|uniref:AraC family transcriptional regulator n=3 Tax=Catenulispora pinisilvae TaxID=2705253 RepID=UPI00189262A8|nr:AraC family transcriptional regulator [Catenulispora pinisilvae]
MPARLSSAPLSSAPLPSAPPARRLNRTALDLHELEVPEVALLPFAVGSFERIGPLSLADFPHRHTFYEIVLVTAGRGRHVVDSQPLPIVPPHFGVIVPGQVHHWEGARGVDGFVLLFNEDFLVRHPEDVSVLQALYPLTWLSPGGAQMAGLVALVAEMERELRAGDGGHEGVLRAYLHILIVRAARIAGAGGASASTGATGATRAVGPAGAPIAGAATVAPVTSAGDLVDRFLRLTAAPGQGNRTLISYAREIGVSPGHLHELVRQQTGLTPGQVTRRQRVVEAKRLLTGTDLAVRQVAEQAGFGDPAYFCRFFRRETGFSPGEFRRRAGGMHHDPVV